LSSVVGGIVDPADAIAVEEREKRRRLIVDSAAVIPSRLPQFPPLSNPLQTKRRKHRVNLRKQPICTHHLSTITVADAAFHPDCGR